MTEQRRVQSKIRLHVCEGRSCATLSTKYISGRIRANLSSVNSLPNDKILYLSKFKQFADDKIIVTQKLKFTMGRMENIVGNGENVGYQHFLLFPQYFQKLSFPEVLKGLCGKELTRLDDLFKSIILIRLMLFYSFI